MHVCARFMITANYHKSNTMLLQILPRYSMLFILFTADSMGVSESLEGMYLQNLCQVIKSSVCPQKDRSTGAERVSLRNNASLIPFVAGGWSLLLPTVSHLTATVGFLWSFQVFGCLYMRLDASFVVLPGTICVVFMLYRIFICLKNWLEFSIWSFIWWSNAWASVLLFVQLVIKNRPQGCIIQQLMNRSLYWMRIMIENVQL